MSGRICYLARADRDTLAQIRLVGVGTDEAWEAGQAGDDPTAVSQRLAEGAAWVAERTARGDGPRHEIDMLCVDVVGASCGWLTAPGTDPAVVSAAMAQESDHSGSTPSGVWSTPTTTESAVQALTAPATKRNGSAHRAQKLAVLAVPDVSARLFIDALDDRGVFVDHAVSLWHAMALAWDPASSRESARMEQIVATSAPVSAVVIIDPVGRLVWSWSRAGELLAAGTIRLAFGAKPESDAPGALVGQAEVGRLATDWLAWSLQIGAAPVRVVCVGSTAGDDSPEALSPQSLGMALGRLWPGATVDLAVHDDPIGATLHRLATRQDGIDAEDGRLELLDLSRRPGRAHRAVYRWASLAVLAGAVALFGVAWKGFSGATSAAEARKQLRDKITTDVKAVVAPKDVIQQARLEASPHAYLEEQVNRKRQALAPATGVEAAKPILQEIETLSLVLGSAGEGVKLDQLSLLNSNVSLYAIVPDTATGEALADSLANVAGTHVEWRPPDFNTPRSGGSAAGGRKSLTLFGRWKSDAPPAPAGGGK